MGGENNIIPGGAGGKERQGRYFLRVGKVPLPVRTGHVWCDVWRKVAVVMIAICIWQQVRIHKIYAGLERVPNDPYDNTFWKLTRTSPEIWSQERQGFIHDAVPVPVHSHNDEWRSIPLFEALGSGCVSVEADVHLVGDELLVGHSATDLRVGDSLRKMYLEPLQRMIDSQNTQKSDVEDWSGIYNHDPQQTVVLLIDHKTAGATTFSELDAELQPLRERDYLTYWNGTDKVIRPLTIVASGNAPFDSVLGLNSTHRDIFWDAPLGQLISIHDDFSISPPRYTYNASNSHFASTPWGNLQLVNWRDPSLPPPETAAEKDAAATQIEQAKARCLLARYWDTPEGPQNLQDIVWRVLVDAEVGILNMDDLGAVRARARGWGKIGMGSKGLSRQALELK